MGIGFMAWVLRNDGIPIRRMQAHLRSIHPRCRNRRGKTGLLPQDRTQNGHSTGKQAGQHFHKRSSRNRIRYRLASDLFLRDGWLSNHGCIPEVLWLQVPEQLALFPAG